MRLRISVILVVLTLFVVASSASATMPWQHKPKQSNPKADAISGAWDAVLTTDDNTAQLTLATGESWRFRADRNRRDFAV
jgi:hypothetical protein